MNKSREKIRTAWRDMKKRCFDPSNSRYHRYGGRGILVCQEWLNDFEAFYHWSLTNGFGANMTIDRVDNDKNYEPTNCRWATHAQQANNTRRNVLVNYRGATMSVAEAVRAAGNVVTIYRAYQRLKTGLPIDISVETPPLARGKRSSF